ncbi:4'-phosphopantetheinyl transferase family protein [Agitococcus lubricus]|uniref:Phosphopantetheine--protein transferase-like protein n=1 Tax=Agitococcus lubricus TaxID=1077255 RepID=A0A2T5J2T2_9GAMM|nr:4'-phosphopantetheinyl transferase superfamily protein [Agitococcus lubricus]PTQ90820.1 phosphopantetheine--protein transferase-like protein [Agitococcus lubricus]
MTKQIDIFIARITWDTEQTYQQLANLPVVMQHAARQYPHPLRLRSYVASRQLLHHAFNQVESSQQAWRFYKQEQRLYICPQQSERFISLSHSDNWVCCLLAPTPYCGIDIEMRPAPARFLAIAKRFFTPQEYQWLAQTQSADLFLDLWTRKEACVKAWHRGLAHHLHRIEFGAEQLSPILTPEDVQHLPLTLWRMTSTDWQLSAAVHLDTPVWQVHHLCW